VSDGTPTLRILDPVSFRETGRIQVHDERGPVGGINELEYARGYLYANIWPTNTVPSFAPDGPDPGLDRPLGAFA
jgi:glutaminyl-peptide cyclotransferase